MSEPFREAIHDLTEQSLWSGTLKFEVSNYSGCIRLIVGGDIGVCEVSIPTSSDALVSFRCDKDLQESCYSLKSFTLGIKALSLSKETFVRFNEMGMICIQYQIETAKGNAYFDFLMLPEEIIP